MTRQDKLNHIKESQFNEDYAHESSYYDWITMKNGEHVPVGAGGKVAEDGPAWAKGKTFDKVTKHKHKGGFHKEKSKATKSTLSADSFPPVFSAKPQDAKNLNKFIEKLNKNESATPEAVNLLNEAKNIVDESGLKDISFVHKKSSSGSQMSIGFNPFSKKIMMAKLSYPMLDGKHDDLIMLHQTHEITHLLNALTSESGKGGDSFTRSYGKLKHALDNTDPSWGEEVDKIVKENAEKRNKLYQQQKEERTKETEKLKEKYKKNTHSYDYLVAKDSLDKKLSAKQKWERDCLDPEFDEFVRFYDSLSKGKFSSSGKVHTGHGTGYFTTKGARGDELLSEYMSLNVASGKYLALLKKDKPEVCEALDSCLRDMVKKVKK